MAQAASTRRAKAKASTPIPADTPTPSERAGSLKRFLAVYLGSPESAGYKRWLAMSEAERKRSEISGMQTWMRWGEQHAAAIVETGGPLGKTKRVDPEGVSAASNAICGYVVVEAESHEAAARMFADHPHFTIFPGEAVEIMECLPIPSM
jgi:hypothetical protein